MGGLGYSWSLVSQGYARLQDFGMVQSGIGVIIAFALFFFLL
jgi:hypothetical protein